jgi:signal transduction histidine kinase
LGGEVVLPADLEDLPPLIGRQPLLVELFGNLLGNAIRYPGDASLRVVIDDAIGIDPRYQEAAFQIFRRRHTRTEYGVGLAVCAKTANSHCGEIRVESEGAGQGATFTVRLPLA